jgi:FkbM family methyltransferase
VTTPADLALPLELGDVVVEVGAGQGGETAYLAGQVGPTGQVIAVEAHPETAAILRHRVAQYANVEVVEAAVWDVVALVPFAANGDWERRSVVPQPDAEETVVVEARTLDSILDGLDDVALLKVNIEGAEADVLRDADLGSVDAAVVACHDFLGRPTKTTVRALLERHGFDVTENPDATEDWHRDYLFARRADKT